MKTHPSTAAAPTRILVFALYKKEAQRLEQTIKRNGFSVMGLHGDLGQEARFKALDAFKEGKVNILVATDVAARGLDIPDVSLVVNVTFPLTTGALLCPGGTQGRGAVLTRGRGLCSSMWTNRTSWKDRKGSHILHW